MLNLNLFFVYCTTFLLRHPLTAKGDSPLLFTSSIYTISIFHSPSKYCLKPLKSTYSTASSFRFYHTCWLLPCLALKRLQYFIVEDDLIIKWYIIR